MSKVFFGHWRNPHQHQEQRGNETDVEKDPQEPAFTAVPATLQYNLDTILFILL